MQLSSEDSFLPGTQAKADAAVARFLYAEGIPFLKVQSPYFQDLLTAVGTFGRGYRAPSIKKLRTSMLDAEVETVKQQLKVRHHERRSAALLYYVRHSTRVTMALYLKSVLFNAAI